MPSGVPGTGSGAAVRAVRCRRGSSLSSAWSNRVCSHATSEHAAMTPGHGRRDHGRCNQGGGGAAAGRAGGANSRRCGRARAGREGRERAGRAAACGRGAAGCAARGGAQARAARRARAAARARGARRARRPRAHRGSRAAAVLCARGCSLAESGGSGQSYRSAHRQQGRGHDGGGSPGGRSSCLDAGQVGRAAAAASARRRAVSCVLARLGRARPCRPCCTGRQTGRVQARRNGRRRLLRGRARRQR